jgi:hypothetical protein
MSVIPAIPDDLLGAVFDEVAQGGQGGQAVNRARTVKRSRRSRAQVDQLDEQICQVLLEDRPQSVRHIFYRMTDPRLPEPVEKSDRGYRAVQYRCLEMRRAGVIPYSCISDTSRVGYHVQAYGDASDFLRRTASLYRGELWEHPEVPAFAEVWVESRSIAGVLRGVCEELAVSLYPAGGFTSATFAFEAAAGLNAQGNTVVFYVGDYDPAGVLIDVAIERELRRHLQPGVGLTFERIAITPEQIDEFDLPSKPRKPGERRAKHIRETVEAEAMPAGIMRQILRERIEELLPAGLLDTVRAAEESERSLILAAAGAA